MNTTLTRYSIKDLTTGFVYDENAGKGLYGLNGQLTIQPEYQRNYVYTKGGKDAAVIESLLASMPIGLMYFVRTASDQLEILDGQQRVTSIGRFVTGKLSAGGKYFSSLDDDQQQALLNTEMLCYECEGTEAEVKQWFETINVSGVPLNRQELLNAVYSGPFVSDARKHLSNPQNNRHLVRAQCIKGSVDRQDHMATALDWISDGDPVDYMARHRADPSATELIRNCDAVVDWALNLFGYEAKLAGLDWGKLYGEYSDMPYSPQELQCEAMQLSGDPAVTKKRGIYEYLLGGKTNPTLLQIRVFDEKTIATRYAQQTAAAKGSGFSNCPACADGGGSKIYTLKEMQADHVTAWSKGGSTTIENCQMLCRMHNAAKSNC